MCNTFYTLWELHTNVKKNKKTKKIELHTTETMIKTINEMLDDPDPKIETEILENIRPIFLCLGKLYKSIHKAIVTVFFSQVSSANLEEKFKRRHLKLAPDSGKVQNKSRYPKWKRSLQEWENTNFTSSIARLYLKAF